MALIRESAGCGKKRIPDPLLFLSFIIFFLFFFPLASGQRAPVGFDGRPDGLGQIRDCPPASTLQSAEAPL